MIHLLNKKNGAIVAEITEKQLQFLEDQLEEESLEDQDYAITNMTLDVVFLPSLLLAAHRYGQIYPHKLKKSHGGGFHA